MTRAKPTAGKKRAKPTAGMKRTRSGRVTRQEECPRQGHNRNPSTDEALRIRREPETAASEEQQNIAEEQARTPKYIDKIVDEPVARQCQVPTIKTAQQPKMDAMRFDECKIFATTEEDLEQDSADAPVAIHGQVPAIQKAQRTVKAPLVQYIDTIIDVPIVKRRQALHIQTVQKTSEVPQIPRWSSKHRTQSRCLAAVH